MKNSEKNNKKIIIEENNNTIENAAGVEIKRKRGRPKKTDNNNLIQLKNKKNNNKKINNAESIENKGFEGDKKINKNNKKNTGKNKNNSVKNNNIIPAQDPSENQVKKRGRPKGTTGITRKDNIHNIVPKEVKQRLLDFNMVLCHLSPVDKNNPLQIQERTNYYFSLCGDYDISPTVAGYALSLGIDRRTLWTWLDNRTDVIKNKQCLDFLKNAYNTINNLYEQLLTEGKIVPVSAFFLMQNNHGYKQQTDHVITANTDNNVTEEDIANKAGLID